MTKRKTLEDIHEDAMRNITEHLKGFSHKLARRKANGTLTDIEYASANIMLEQQIALKTLNTSYTNFKTECIGLATAFAAMREEMHALNESYHHCIDDTNVAEEDILSLTRQFGEFREEHEVLTESYQSCVDEINAAEELIETIATTLEEVEYEQDV